MTQPNLSHSFTPTYHKTAYAALSPTTNPTLSAANKSIFITGGATGIGFAIATAFASAQASHIALLGRRQERLDDAKIQLMSEFRGIQVNAYAGSVADEVFVEHAMQDSAKAAGGKVDVLVSCAGQLLMRDSTLDASAADIRDVYDTNLFGALNAVRAFLALPVDGVDSERIIIDVSTAGVHLDEGGHSAYCASKAALTSMLRRIGAEHRRSASGDHRLRVHSFHPGIVFTELAGRPGDGRTGKEPWYDDVELAGAFSVWLASKEAWFLSGRFVWANWDVEELVGRREEVERDERNLTLGLLVEEPLYSVVR